MADILDTSARVTAARWSAITGFSDSSPEWEAIKQVLVTCGLLDDPAYALFTVGDTAAAWKQVVCLLAGAHYAADHDVDVADATEVMATLINDFYGVREDYSIDQMVARLRAEVPLRLLGIHQSPGAALRDALGDASIGKRDKLATLVLDQVTANDTFCVTMFDRLAADPQFWLKLARTCGGRWVVYRNNM